jgi:hypothetical protein
MRIIFIAMFYCTVVGCTSDSTVVVPQNPLTGLPDKGPIRLSSPAIGQRSYYTFFTAKDNTGNVSFSYPGDTLIIGITGFESDQWVVKEFLSDGSISKKKSTSSSAFWKGYADSVFTSYMKIDPYYINVSRPANRTYNSFAFAGRNWAFQIADVLDTEPSNPQCSPAFYYRSTVWMEYSKDYTQFGKTFEKLNIHFDYRDMSTDGFGFMYAYQMPHGFVRISWVNYWELSKANGWDLIAK